MAKRFVVPFAATGDKSTTPDATDPTGLVSYSQGWGADYQKGNAEVGYKPIGRQEMNGLLNDVTGALAELQTLGAAEWVAVTGLVTPYVINAQVRHNGSLWQSLVANNSEEPGSVTTSASKWRNVSNLLTLATGRLIGIRVFNANTTYTPTPGTTSILVEVQGGGGGGGGSAACTASQYAIAGGGASGAYAKSYLTSGFSGIPVVVGAAGTAGAAGGVGGTGGGSSFGSITAGGGPGGTFGNATTNTVNVLAQTTGAVAVAAGGNLENSQGNSTVFGYGAGVGAAISGGGNASLFGGGARGNVGAQNPGAAASSYGAGGAGGLTAASGAAQVGGAGGAGVVIIAEYS